MTRALWNMQMLKVIISLYFFAFALVQKALQLQKVFLLKSLTNFL